MAGFNLKGRLNIELTLTSFPYEEGHRVRQANTAKTPTKVAASPNQVSAYSKWLFGNRTTVSPPFGQGWAGSASASTTKGATRVRPAAAAMAGTSRLYHWPVAGSSFGTNQP